VYHLYHTEAFVLSSADIGEGNKSFTLFTRDLGLLSASATSVREERSKLRFALQDLSLAELTLVRGRTAWRVTNAAYIDNVRSAFCRRESEARLFARIFRVLRRLLAGEEKNEQLFLSVKEAFNFLRSHTGKAAAEAEVVLVLRILFLLGYLAPRGEFEHVLCDVALWNDALLSDARAFRSLALQDINHSLQQAQL